MALLKPENNNKVYYIYVCCENCWDWGIAEIERGLSADAFLKIQTCPSCLVNHYLKKRENLPVMNSPSFRLTKGEKTND